MTLLTPPSSGHRRRKEKENSVVWSESNKIHILQLAIAPKVSTTTSASKRPPTKSILKKSTALLAPWPQENSRQVTPEPSDPLVNLLYLDYPVSTIVQATDSTELRPLIEAYSVLMARLRASITGATDADASWPLFQPLRKHRDAFVAAVVRDLGRALVDPGKGEEASRILLPSPKNTPKKKRDGMTAEQVKYARDLATTSHAVIRLLSLVFTLPAVLNVFTDAQLREMLTAVLAIPLKDELPTPNARKTWALAIWLIQIQRLPADVLSPAADRIAMALCRGIEGELGRDGKKGSASDGLKAIHDLSIHLPAVFIPAFTHNVLPAVLATLLSPTLALRTPAAHALGGFVLGTSTLPTSTIHTQISHIVATFITTTSPPSPTKTTSSPTKQSRDPAILRTLRTTLQATEPAHVAHGPAWGTCVLSSLLVLLGAGAVRHAPLRALAPLGLRHKNRAVRALTAVMWRVVLWVYLQPPFDEAEEEEGGREEWWRLVASVTEFETGVCTLAAYVGSTNAGVPVYEGDGEGEEERLRRGLEVLYAMVCKDAATCSSAVDTMKQLVGAPRLSSPPPSESGEMRTLLPKGLFSALPGLLSTEFGALKNVVNPLFEETPKAEDVRPLTRAEVGRRWIWDGLVKAWRAAVEGKGVSPEEAERERGELVRVWEGMVGLGLGAVLDAEDDVDHPTVEWEEGHDPERVEEFTLRAVDVLVNNVLEDANLELSVSTPHTKTQRGLDIPGFTTTTTTTTTAASTLAKLTFARELWRVLCRVVPQAMLSAAAERLLACLMRNVEEYTAFGGAEEDGAEEMNQAWAEFCVEVAAVSGGEGVRVFWGYTEAEGEGERWTCGWTEAERKRVWRVFVRGWMQQGSAAGWEGGVCILGVPFARSIGEKAWKFCTGDAKAWQELLEHTVATALDYGHDANAVLGALAALVAEDPYVPAHIRLVEFVLTHLGAAAGMEEVRELPEGVLEWAGRTMVLAYPPLAGRDQTTYRWAVRALAGLVERCPRELLGVLGERMGEAIAVWVGDAEGGWEKGVVEYDILPLYQTVLVAIQGLPLASDVLQMFESVLSAPFAPDAREEIREPAKESFREFWDATYARVNAPKGGWGEDVRVCLAAVYGVSKEEAKAESNEPELEAAFIPRPSTPTTPAIAPTVPTTPITSSPCFIRNTTNTLSTPRPHKSSRFFAQLPFRSPESPTAPSRVSRPPTPRTTRSPTKRRKLSNGDKENLSPVQERVIPSVLERIGVLGSPKVALGKRRFEEDTATDSEDEKNVMRSLVVASDEDDVFLVAPSKSKRDGKSILKAELENDSVPTPTPQKKRKRMVLDAVEVPLLSEVYARRLRASVSFEAVPTVVRTPTMVTRSMRRTRSETKARGGSDISSGSGSGSRKRRRGSWSNDEDGTLPLEEQVPSTRTLRRTQSQQLKQVGHGRLPSSELSSDDDPHIGQVTPHHLISPELKRGRGLDLDLDVPSSDDSVMAASPSRDLVQRRLRRLGSMTGKEKVKPFVL